MIHFLVLREENDLDFLIEHGDVEDPVCSYERDLLERALRVVEDPGRRGALLRRRDELDAARVEWRKDRVDVAKVYSDAQATSKARR